MIRTLHIKTVLFFVSFLGLFFVSISYVHADDTIPLDNSITLIGSDGESVSFPSYLKYVSPDIGTLVQQEQLENEKEKNIFGEAEKSELHFKELDSTVLHQLKRDIDLLPKAARDRNGLSVKSTDIDRHTIFVNSEVKSVLKEEVKNIKNSDLYQLFRATDLLGIDRLKNAYAYFIAERIFSSSHGKLIDLEKYLNKMGFIKDIEPKQFRKIGFFTEDQFIYIKKNFFLLKSTEEEQSIADYIALGGEISITEDGTLNLSNKKLTSLHGIHLIRDVQKVKYLNLGNNLLLGSDLDPEFPTQPFWQFTKLETLRLSNNQFKVVTGDIFQGLISLKRLYLEENQFPTLPATLFQGGLANLYELNLYDNQLITLPATVFQRLTNLRNLNLAKNKFNSLPATLFQGLTNLQQLSLDENRLLHTFPSTLFQGLTNLRQLSLDEDTYIYYSSPATIFQGLTNLQRLYLYATNPVAVPLLRPPVKSIPVHPSLQGVQIAFWPPLQGVQVEFRLPYWPPSFYFRSVLNDLYSLIQ